MIKSVDAYLRLVERNSGGVVTVVDKDGFKTGDFMYKTVISHKLLFICTERNINALTLSLEICGKLEKLYLLHHLKKVIVDLIFMELDEIRDDDYISILFILAQNISILTREPNVT